MKIDYERERRLWNATSADMPDDERLRHVVGVMMMLDGDNGWPFGLADDDEEPE